MIPIPSLWDSCGKRICVRLLGHCCCFTVFQIQSHSKAFVAGLRGGATPVTGNARKKFEKFVKPEPAWRRWTLGLRGLAAWNEEKTCSEKEDLSQCSSHTAAGVGVGTLGGAPVGSTLPHISRRKGHRWQLWIQIPHGLYYVRCSSSAFHHRWNVYGGHPSLSGWWRLNEMFTRHWLACWAALSPGPGVTVPILLSQPIYWASSACQDFF